MLRDAVLPIGAVAMATAVLRSEQVFRRDKRDRPVDVELHQLAHRITGEGDSTIVFIHGWPDDPAIFHRTVARLSSRYRCVNVCLPNYPAPFGYVPACLPERTYGYEMDEAATLLYATMRKTCPSTSHVTLFMHDWGCIVGYLVAARYKVDRLVSLDVGWFAQKVPPPSGIPGRLVGAAAVLAYQGLLNVFFLLPTALGSALSSAEAALLGRFAAPDAGPVVASMDWPYRSMWRSVVTWNPGVIPQLDGFQPQCPWLFVYGTKLPSFLRFQDEGFIKRVEASCPGVSRAVPIGVGALVASSCG